AARPPRAGAGPRRVLLLRGARMVIPAPHPVVSPARPDDAPGLPADLSVLHVDHRAAFWHRMDRNYRRKYEAMRRHRAFTCWDVREGPRRWRRRFDVLIVGVFGCPLHPRFPVAAPLPAAAFDLARARCLMVEDLRERTYVGGLDQLCRH